MGIMIQVKEIQPNEKFQWNKLANQENYQNKKNKFKILNLDQVKLPMILELLNRVTCSHWKVIS
jgi:hypothetical protein